MVAKYNREMADLEEALHVTNNHFGSDCRPKHELWMRLPAVYAIVMGSLKML